MYTRGNGNNNGIPLLNDRFEELLIQKYLRICRDISGSVPTKRNAFVAQWQTKFLYDQVYPYIDKFDQIAYAHTLIVNSIFKNAVEFVQRPWNGELSKREIANNDATLVANQNNNSINLEND